MQIILYYVHDPMCSWCWGFTRTLTRLVEQLPPQVEVQRVLGGLAADTDSPMPLSMQEQIKSNWTRIEDTITGVKFNFDFWTKTVPRRSTYPACRAVIAARQQGDENDIKMTKAIQHAYYQQARNPSDDDTLIDLAKELNLVVSDFKNDLNSNEINEKLTEEINLSRELFAESFPNLVLKIEYDIFSIPINYNDSQVMLDTINTLLSRQEI